jgi:hypothetical protein
MDRRREHTKKVVEKQKRVEKHKKRRYLKSIDSLLESIRISEIYDLLKFV